MQSKLALGFLTLLLFVPMLPSFAATQVSVKLTFDLKGAPQAGCTVQSCPLPSGTCTTKMTNLKGSVTLFGAANSQDTFTAWNKKGVACTSGYFTFPPTGSSHDYVKVFKC